MTICQYESVRIRIKKEYTKSLYHSVFCNVFSLFHWIIAKHTWGHSSPPSREIDKNRQCTWYVYLFAAGFNLTCRLSPIGFHLLMHFIRHCALANSKYEKKKKNCHVQFVVPFVKLKTRQNRIRNYASIFCGFRDSGLPLSGNFKEGHHKLCLKPELFFA